ncbi:MAG: DUF421 domain-containing protein [Tenericutes bacterium]|nr:DUF421 domain-containing protein [Mycoplasmatota bacterium]
MLYLDIVYRSLLSILVLFFLTKLSGKKQVSQLNMYDYIVGITIGSIAAELSINNDVDYLAGIISMIVYILISIFISVITTKSIFLRKFLTGVPIVLINNGEIIYKNLQKAKLDINDLLREARIMNFFNINEIEYALMEANGKISFILKKEYDTPTLNDLKIKGESRKLEAEIIIDGKIIYKNLTNIKKDEKWLKKELAKKGYKNFDNILLLTYGNKINIFEKNIKEKNVDVLE